MKTITLTLTPSQLEIVLRSLQHTATAILAARDSHLLTQAESERKHRKTWEVYCDLTDKLLNARIESDLGELSQ